MNELRELLANFWITPEADRQKFYRIRSAIPKFERFFQEQTGWQLVNNEKVIKLEKLPAHAEAFMGIEEFQTPLEYCLLCGLLMVLEDKDDGEPFLLSELTVQLKAYLQEDCPDLSWEIAVHRRALVRVLKYAVKQEMLHVFEGDGEAFSGEKGSEVLYENTGRSRWFAAHHATDVHTRHCADDFEKNEELDQDRGTQRIHRVYRQLVVSPAAFWQTPEDALYAYIKNERSWVEHYLDQAIGGRLEVHKNGAFFVLEEDDRFGCCYPQEKTLHTILLQLCGQLRGKVLAGHYTRLENDFVEISRQEFNREVENCRGRFAEGWGKQWRETPQDKLACSLLESMEDWQFLYRKEDALWLTPAIAKWSGAYPAGYKTKQEEAT